MRENQNILVLGGTGSVGGAVAEVLRQRNHHVTCLARSVDSEAILKAKRFRTLRGDIRAPSEWLTNVSEFDAIVHAAITWSDDMAQVDQNLVNELLKPLARAEGSKTLIYTSGCWAYGNTGDDIATEVTPYDPLPAFAWSIEVAQQVRENTKVRGMVIFPAMVYGHDGDVFEPWIEDARLREKIRIIGGENVRWPLVHRMDLAHLYALMIECGNRGASYNGAGIVSMEIGIIARAIAKCYNKPSKLDALPVQQALKELGSWAKGYALDQQMSSAKAMHELGWTPVQTDILAELSVNRNSKE
ncbi:MAG: NAD-dependent epimerase/dehydratase family protein [Robiginitomaculum sp.]|nr:NAD-dependent epimerase/dehydratase family protein [Robiginitomaculum sp.]